MGLPPWEFLAMRDIMSWKIPRVINRKVYTVRQVAGGYKVIGKGGELNIVKMTTPFIVLNGGEGKVCKNYSINILSESIQIQYF